MTIPIKTLLRSFLQSKRESWKITLLETWPQIVGPLVTKVTIKKIDEEQIVLSVCDSCWMQELYLLSPTLLEAINKNLDQRRIKRIRFVLMETRQSKKPKNSPSTEINDPSVHLMPVEQTALARIKDPELRICLESFLMRCYREKKK